jgi:hypothetical protein
VTGRHRAAEKDQTVVVQVATFVIALAVILWVLSALVEHTESSGRFVGPMPPAVTLTPIPTWTVDPSDAASLMP